MKISEIIAKYEPLGWKINKVVDLDTYYTFQSPRMAKARGLTVAFGKIEDEEINEEEMLQRERYYFIAETYFSKIITAFDSVRSDITRQLEILDKKGLAIPEQININFDLKLK